MHHLSHEDCTAVHYVSDVIIPNLRPDLHHTAARCTVKKGQKVWTIAGHKRDLGTPLGHPSTGLTVWEGVVERKGKNSKGQDLMDVKFPDKTMYFAPYDVVVAELETLFVMPISFIPESEAENLSPTTPKRPRNSEGSSGTPSMPQKKNKGGQQRQSRVARMKRQMGRLLQVSVNTPHLMVQVLQSIKKISTRTETRR